MILKAVGGEIGSASALAPKLGPLGLVSPYFYYCLSRGDVRIFIFVLSVLTTIIVSQESR